MPVETRITIDQWRRNASQHQWLLDYSHFVFDILLHLVLLTAALLPIAILIFRRKSQVRWSDFFALTIVLIAVPTAFAATSIPDDYHHFILGYTVLSSSTLFIAWTITLSALIRSKPGIKARHIIGGLTITGIAIGLSLPAVPSARQAAQRMECQKRLHHLTATLLIHGLLGKSLENFAPNNTSTSPDLHAVSWRIQLLPYLNESAVYEQYSTSHRWDSAENNKIARLSIPAFTCPSEPNLVSLDGYRFTSYARVVNSNLDPNNPNLISRPSPLTWYSRAILLESCGANIVWTEPRDIELDKPRASQPHQSAKPWQSTQLGSSFHGAVFTASFEDGSIRSIPASIDSDVLVQLLLGRQRLDD